MKRTIAVLVLTALIAATIVPVLGELSQTQVEDSKALWRTDKPALQEETERLENATARSQEDLSAAIGKADRIIDATNELIGYANSEQKSTLRDRLSIYQGFKTRLQKLAPIAEVVAEEPTFAPPTDEAKPAEVTGYVTKADLEELFANVATKADIEEATSGLVDETRLAEATSVLVDEAELEEATSGLVNENELGEYATEEELAEVKETADKCNGAIGAMQAAQNQVRDTPTFGKINVDIIYVADPMPMVVETYGGQPVGLTPTFNGIGYRYGLMNGVWYKLPPRAVWNVHGFWDWPGRVA